MEYREPILVMARHQPILPTAVAQALNTTSILAGAMLSEMSSKGLLKISFLKVGGSPLYYVPGNESQLLNHTKNLNEKDRQTVEKLKQEVIIRETTTDPLTRVSLAQVKDFAIPLLVEYDGKQERFWKWFQLSDDDAKERIKAILDPAPQEKPKEIIADKPQKKIEPQQSKLEPVKTVKPEDIPKTEPKTATGEFWDLAHQFFTENKITLQEKIMIKKNTDYDLLITVPSPMGALTYYCKARGKKRITDADISAAYVQGQIKKLPVIFLTGGELTKKAKEVLTQLKGITLKQL